MIIKDAKFVRSVGKVNQLWNTEFDEVAIVGRSNVGKSSLINFLLSRKGLAKTSSTPGRTRLINYFDINGQFYFVDLPGYGFAKGNKVEQVEWKSLIGGYFEASTKLKVVCLLLDIRREINEQDKLMIKWLMVYNVPFVIIITKADKVPNTQRKNMAQKIASSVGVGIGNVYICSTVSKIGREEIWQKLEQFLEDNDSGV